MALEAEDERRLGHPTPKASEETSPLLPPDDRLSRDDDDGPPLSFLRTCVIILSLSGVAFSASISNGLLSVGLPTIAADIELPSHLLLWPPAVYALTCGCCLLLAGSIADKIGDRLINLTGTALLAVFVLAQGLAQTGTQLIVFRGLQGVGVSMCLPTGVSIITRSLPPGRTRNMAFSSLGIAQPLGFSLGLVMEGAIETAGHWRLGYYICAGILVVLLVSNLANIFPQMT